MTKLEKIKDLIEKRLDTKLEKVEIVWEDKFHMCSVKAYTIFNSQLDIAVNLLTDFVFI